MKRKIAFIVITIIFSASNILGQTITLKENDSDADKFIGTWTYESSDTTFSVTFAKHTVTIGEHKVTMLWGSWKIKNTLGEKNTFRDYAVIAGTTENPNILEGSISPQDSNTQYNFTLEMTNTTGTKARWTITDTQNLNTFGEKRVQFSPPTTCIMVKR